MTNVYVKKLGTKKWTVVTDYGRRGGTGRQGVWLQDAMGGYCVGDTVTKALRSCGRPVTHRTKREAERAAREAAEYSIW
jgi:hypothetical protein